MSLTPFLAPFGGGSFPMDPFALLMAPFEGRMGMPDVGQMQRGGHPLDVIETDSSYMLRCDVPGMAAEDLSIELNEGVITISGKKRREAEEKDQEGRVLRRERQFSHFTRSMTVPDYVKEDDVTASLANGVLEVTIPKANPPERPQPKKIAVQTAHADAGAGAPKVTHHAAAGGGEGMGMGGEGKGMGMGGEEKGEAMGGGAAAHKGKEGHHAMEGAGKEAGHHEPMQA